MGSNTAKAVKNKKIERMSIKILLKSTSDPTILLEIFKAGKDRAILETKNTADKFFYEGLMKEVTGIKDIFSIIIDIVDKSCASQNMVNKADMEYVTKGDSAGLAAYKKAAYGNRNILICKQAQEFLRRIYIVHCTA